MVGSSVYLIDCGEGVGRQYLRAGLGGQGDLQGLERLRGIFLTHLHSDHTIDYANLLILGLYNGLPDVAQPIQIYGPGNRGILPPIFGSPSVPPPVINAGNPTPGTVEMTDYLLRAYATDINDRLRDNLKPDPASLIRVHDISLPHGVGSDPNGAPAQPMEPFFVFEDENVRVSATLVYHAPVFPSFAFRFDTTDGSIVFSGDTGPCQNLVTLAQDADILVHEVIDVQWVEHLVGSLPRTVAMESLLQHMLQAHTTIEDVGKVAEAARVNTLVLSHLVPGNNAQHRWLAAQNNFSGQLVVGDDLLQIGVGQAPR